MTDADRAFLRDFSAGCEDPPSGGGVLKRMQEVALPHLDRSGHEVVTEARDAPAAGAGDLGDQAADVEAFEDARDSRAEGALTVRRVWFGVELPADVAVTEARDRVLAAEDCAEDMEVFEVEGVEAAYGAAPDTHGPGESVELAEGRGRVAHGRQRVEVAAVGGARHLGEAKEVGDALRQGNQPTISSRRRVPFRRISSS